ncbi:MAG: ATP synthase F0 subunit B [Candidatus Moranbacteria bacterium RBG_13_45_13]|nr:MAG: ATP synthase F0 subunit B [Candidatus Moranbacteria bacterium RBG_13_45_13]
MSELLSKLGIDWKLLIAQIVNFLVLLFVLYKFAYGPILAMLEKRQKKIEKGLKDAEEAHKKLEESEEKQKGVLKHVRTEAKDIVEKARVQAEKGKSEIAAEAKAQAEKIITGAKAEIAREKEKTIGEIKSEIGGLVAMAAEKIIGEKMDEEKDNKLIEESLK